MPDLPWLYPHMDCSGYDIVWPNGYREVMHISYDRSYGKVTEIRAGYTRHPDGRITDRFRTETVKHSRKD
jgi:hypothetical protein